MYVLGVYDINVKRVAKVKKIFSQYLFRVQNSTFEGDLTKAQLAKLKNKLQQVVIPDEDYVIFYVIRSEELLDKIYLGESRAIQPSNII